MNYLTGEWRLYMNVYLDYLLTGLHIEWNGQNIYIKI